MSNDIIPFNFEGNQQRVLRDTEGNPLFVATDSCQILGYSNTSKAIADHVDAEDKFYVDVRGGITSGYTPGSTLLLNESGLYALIFGSNKPEAKAFKRKVTHEIIPTIRKTGGYVSKPITLAEQALINAQALVEQERRLAAMEKAQAEQADRLALIEAEYAAGKHDPNLMTVAAYARWKGLTLTEGELSTAGRRAKRYSDQHALPMNKAVNRVHGYSVGMYHVKALEWAFAQGRLIE